MVNTNPETGTSLEQVAQHERKLLDNLEAAKADAAQTVVDARRAGEEIAAERQRALDAETARLRAEAESAQRSAREAILQETESRIESARASAQSRVGSAVDEIAGVILPGGSA